MARITPKNVRKFQDGGAAPAPEQQAPAQAAPQGGASAGGGDPQAQIQQILQVMQQAVQNQDGQLALQACAALLQVLGAGGAPQGGADQGPAMARNGGRIFRRGINGRFER